MKFKKQDGVTVLLHPTRTHRTNLKEATNKIDVIEALNGRTRRWENLKAKNLALRLNKPVIAGSDANLSFEIGRVRTVFKNASNTSENIRKHIINGERTLVGKESPYLVHAFSFGTQIIKYALRLT